MWGREAVGPFKSVLRRRRYDWSWHATALHAALESLAPHLEIGTPFLGLVGETEPGFISAAFIAADQAGYSVEGLALRADIAQAQITWRRAPASTLPGATANPVDYIRRAAISLLEQRSQPAVYLHLHTAAVANLAADRYFSNAYPNPAEAASTINELLEEACSYRRGFLRFGGSDKSMEAGLWWHREVLPSQPPLADRVEMATVAYLLKHPGATSLEVDAELCTTFPGLLTPAAELVHLCIQSYAAELAPGSQTWQIRPEDQPKVRRADIDEIDALLQEIAIRLGLIPEGKSPQIWRAPTGEVVRNCYVIASAVVGELLLSAPSVDGRRVSEQPTLVLPGGRANLLAYKLQRDPRLRQAVDNGWRVIKYRQVRLLAYNPALSPSSLENLLEDDFLTYDAPQLRLF